MQLIHALLSTTMWKYKATLFTVRSVVLEIVLLVVTFVASSAQNIGGVGIPTSIPTEKEPMALIQIYSFRGVSLDSQRVDIYCAIPYERLDFLRNASNDYAAQYTIRLTVLDASSNTVLTKTIERMPHEKEYDISRGSTGKSDITQTVIGLTEGTYSVEIFISDALAKRDMRIRKKIIVPNYTKKDFSMSSLMLVSSVEERPNNHVIMTPHLSDNITGLTEGLFVFFETYNQASLIDTLAFAWELFDVNGKRVAVGTPVVKDVRSLRQQYYLRIDVPKSLSSGNYTLRLSGVDRFAPLIPTENIPERSALLRAECSLSVEHTVASMVLADIDKAIRQMKYVASQEEIDNIFSGSSLQERKSRFEKYWAALDPSPGTPRNEAFDEYYTRIDYTNRNFKSYNDGWLTDMGMVYVVLGPPQSSDRQGNRMDGRQFISWTYALRNRRFQFFDATGFNDYRLSPSTPFSLGERYRYE